MLNTEVPSKICPKRHAISLLLSNDNKLLGLLFHENHEGLRAEPEEIIEFARGYSTGQQLLVRIALDIWSGGGKANLWDILTTLDLVRFEAFMLALESLMFSR